MGTFFSLAVLVRCRTIHRSMASISATPTNTLVDEQVKIKLSGLEPGSKVTVRSYLPEPGSCFEAHTHFEVNADGVVAVDQQPSVGGTYTGEQMGYNLGLYGGYAALRLACRIDGDIFTTAQAPFATEERPSGKQHLAN